MLCSKCGAENPAEARFCGKCGTPVTSGPPVILLSQVAENLAMRSSLQKKSWLTPTVILVGVVVIILGISGLVALVHFAGSSQSHADNSGDSKSAATTMPPIGIPPSPSKFADYNNNNTLNTPANTTQPTSLTEDSDNVYCQKILGNWQVRKFLDTGAYFDVQTSYLSGGRAVWSGTMTHQGQTSYVTWIGTWEIKKGILYTRIESSSTPQLVRSGQTSTNKIISITDEEWTYMDPQTGERNTVVRVK